MKVSRQDIQEKIAALKQQRDELKLHLHLAKAEARDEWNRLEEKWEDIRIKAENVCEEAGKTAGSVSTALVMALEEIKKGYERIRNII
jgi:archaellum component FlaC